MKKLTNGQADHKWLIRSLDACTSWCRLNCRNNPSLNYQSYKMEKIIT